MEKVTLIVNGMSCGHCVKAVEGSVGALNGVKNVHVELSEGKVEVEYDSTVVSVETIKATIDDQGYDVA